MALLICQKCSAVNLADAAACQKCGHQILTPEQWEKKRRWKDFGLLIGISAGLLLIVAGLLIINGRSRQAPSKPDVATLGGSAGAPLKTSAVEATNHVSETATVCGLVASAKYAMRSRRRPTVLNLDEPYPRQIFTVVILGEDREKFGMPETRLKGKRICVTGKIEEYKGKPQTVLREPGQLKIEE